MEIARDSVKAGTCFEARAQSFEVFAEARRADAVRLAFRLLRGDSAAAEDVAQNAFLRAHRSLAQFREQAALDTWFYRILVREVHRHRRWQAVRNLWSAEPARRPEPADERPPGDPGLRRRISAALEKLSGPQREAFVLVHLEGFTFTETAAIVGKAAGTVKTHVHRALQSLRRELADLREPEHGGRNSTGGET